jgi:hypothetical protein
VKRSLGDIGLVDRSLLSSRQHQVLSRQLSEVRAALAVITECIECRDEDALSGGSVVSIRKRSTTRMNEVSALRELHELERAYVGLNVKAPEQGQSESSIAVLVMNQPDGYTPPDAEALSLSDGVAVDFEEGAVVNDGESSV